MGIEEVLTAPRSPWQNPFAKGGIGSIGRECLDQVIVLNERHLRRILASYFDYYHRSWTHLSLDKDAPDERPVQQLDAGKLVACPCLTSAPLGLPSDFVRTGLLLLRSGYVRELAAARYPHIQCGGGDFPSLAGGVRGERRLA